MIDVHHQTSLIQWSGSKQACVGARVMIRAQTCLASSNRRSFCVYRSADEGKWDNDPRKPFFQVGENKPFPDCVRPKPNQKKKTDVVDSSADYFCHTQRCRAPPRVDETRRVSGPPGDQTNSETELEGFSPSSNLIYIVVFLSERGKAKQA